MKDILQQYEYAVEQVTMFFCQKYFKDDYLYDRKDWVGGEIGGVICINDYYFNIETMLDYLKYKYGVKKMFEHYDYDLDERTFYRSPICIRDWKKLKK